VVAVHGHGRRRLAAALGLGSRPVFIGIAEIPERAVEVACLPCVEAERCRDGSQDVQGLAGLAGVAGVGRGPRLLGELGLALVEGAPGAPGPESPGLVDDRGPTPHRLWPRSARLTGTRPDPPPGIAVVSPTACRARLKLAIPAERLAEGGAGGRLT